MQMENLRFDPKTDTPANFQLKDNRVYPPPNPPPMSEIKAAAQNAAEDQARFDRQTQVRDSQIQCGIKHRNEQIESIFLRSKMLEQPANFTVDEFHFLARRQMVIRDICRNEDYPEDGFIEISESVSSIIVSVLTKTGRTQEAMEKNHQDLIQKFEEKTIVENKRPISNTNNADPSNRPRDFNQR